MGGFNGIYNCINHIPEINIRLLQSDPYKLIDIKAPDKTKTISNMTQLKALLGEAKHDGKYFIKPLNKNGELKNINTNQSLSFEDYLSINYEPNFYNKKGLLGDKFLGGKYEIRNKDTLVFGDVPKIEYKEYTDYRTELHNCFDINLPKVYNEVGNQITWTCDANMTTDPKTILKTNLNRRLQILDMHNDLMNKYDIKLGNDIKIAGAINLTRFNITNRTLITEYNILLNQCIGENVKLYANFIALEGVYKNIICICPKTLDLKCCTCDMMYIITDSLNIHRPYSGKSMYEEKCNIKYLSCNNIICRDTLVDIEVFDVSQYAGHTVLLAASDEKPYMHSNTPLVHIHNIINRGNHPVVIQRDKDAAVWNIDKYDESIVFSDKNYD